MIIRRQKHSNLKTKIIINLSLIITTVSLTACGGQKAGNVQEPVELAKTITTEEIETIKPVEETEISKTEEEKKYSPDELVILVLNNGQKLEYRFGEVFNDQNNNAWKYQLVTSIEDVYDARCFSYPTEAGYVTQTVENLTELNQAWVPDYKVAVSTLDASILLEQNQEYTKEELANIENEKNMNLNRPYEYLEEETFKTDYLFIVECNEERYIFDSRFYLRILEETEVDGVVSSRNVIYFYNPLNPKNAIKCSYGISALEEQKLREEGVTSFDITIEEFTSLNRGYAENFDNKSEIKICYDVTPFLTEQQKANKEMTYQELKALHAILNYRLEQEHERSVLS